jgi:hypothetical protein
MAETLKKPTKIERLNPFDASLYLKDPKDEQQEERGEPRHFWYVEFKPSGREPVGQLEMYMRSLAESPVEKPRWQKLVEHANSLADELKIPREQFYWTALVEYIEKLENARVTDELNEAYKNIDREEDVAFLNRLVRYYDPRLADE